MWVWVWVWGRGGKRRETAKKWSKSSPSQESRFKSTEVDPGIEGVEQIGHAVHANAARRSYICRHFDMYAGKIAIE